MHDPVSPWEQLQRQAWRFDFFSALRCLDALDPQRPRLGTSEHLREDLLRLGQAVSLAFEPAMLRNLQLREGLPPQLRVTFFGLTGVNGPMPLPFSEEALSRQINHNDGTLASFLDIFHHRLLCLLYRSWAMARPVVCADRPGQDRFSEYVQAFVPHSERYYASQYLDQRRSAEGLLGVLRDHLQVPVTLHQWHGRWSALAPTDQLQLGAGTEAAQLGRSSLLGRRAWNVQHSVRVTLGPLSLADMTRFLPGTEALRDLARLVDDYLGCGFEWDVQLLLAPSANTPMRLGGNLSLGLTSWLSSNRPATQPRACVLTPARLQ